MTIETGQRDRTREPTVATTRLPRYTPWQGISVTPISGDEHGLDGFSLILAETKPGGGVPAHSHPYQEVFIVREGLGRWIVGEKSYIAGPGDIVIAPANLQHMFVNDGTEVMRHTSIQLTGTLGDALHRHPMANALNMTAEIDG
ncbi:MAG: cupin domain-containing protein [Thermomicrobiales bacterium]